MQQQEARVDGYGNTVIQILGDGNTVNVGRSHTLRLTRYLTHRTINTDLERLSPYSRFIPLVGRANELADLWSFLEAPSPMQARVLIGGGGSGKTRLALELCEQAVQKGWAAGFVKRNEFQRFKDQRNASQWYWDKPTLLVIDYASGVHSELSTWLDELTDRDEEPQYPLRILLLDRSASVDGGWFETVFYSGGWGATNKRALLSPAKPVEIPPIAQIKDRLSLLQSMLNSIHPNNPLQLPAGDVNFETQLMGLEWGGDPLFLMMAALEMARTGNGKVLTLGRAELALQVAEHERERITRIARAKKVDETLVHHLAACVTLAQGIAPKALLEFANTEKSAIGRDAGSSASLVDALCMALGKQKMIEPIRPDLIGEAYIVLAMRALEDHELSMEAVQRCYEKFGNKVVESVVRCVMDFSSPDEKSLLVWMEGLVKANWDKPDGLELLRQNIPMDSVTLRNTRLQAAQRVLELVGNEPTPEQAAALNNLATALNKVGRQEEALEAVEKAVALCKTLAMTNTNDVVFVHGLALSLSNMAGSLGELNKREEALEAMQEAVVIYQTLAATHPDVFNYYLAGSLNNMANFLSELGQREEALKVAQDSVIIYRVLAEAQPDVFNPNLAMSLNNVANRLSDLGKREEALAAAQESVALYKDLAATRPDVFNPDLAMSLNNIANRLSDLGRLEEALAAAQEAVSIRRTLAATRPDIFKSALAKSFIRLENILTELGKLEEALVAAKEAVKIHRALAATHHTHEFNPDLAESLIVLALQYEAHNPIQASHFAHEAITTLQASFMQRPLVHQELMVFILQTYARQCQAAGISVDTGLINPLQNVLQQLETKE